MLLVLTVPQLQLILHGIHILLNVVHGPAQGKCALAQSLDRDAELLYLLRNDVLLLLPCRLKDERFLLPLKKPGRKKASSVLRQGRSLLGTLPELVKRHRMGTVSF
jgi:hypothetical protein